ncbi:endonuclease/exonuclease/phosphatase family protein [Allosaccharopolyspora coralli]|uniref:endonuclease/exonuclease/phosphatase family protein n=1 Tax=Allosaccharopolyspora coralli TaxID=2665642 RepID=UPI001E40FE06|nr:endonuclease/exonuclease/phosphatase family protein [Allosaccharopolyspora coralli]
MSRSAPIELDVERTRGDDEREGRRAPRGPIVTVLLLSVAVPFLGWATVSLVGYDRDPYTAALVALTQYAVPVGGALVLVGLLLHRWLTTLLVLLATIGLALHVAPRAVPNTSAPVQGTPVKVMSINLYFGGADVRRVVELVRAEQVDALVLQELTPESAEALDRAGLTELLPHRVFEPRPGAAGSGIASRWPLRELSIAPPSTMQQPSALIDSPGPGELEVVGVHPVIPVGDTATWQDELRALPEPARDAATPRVLAGDFNATLDHSPMRRLLGQGYEDAAATTGDGLQGTWPGADVRIPPPMTIDHVLVSGGATVQGYQRFDVAGGDHRAILTHLTLPA